MRLPGTTPAAPDDDGSVDPTLAEAIATGDSHQVGAALFGARLLVPVVAEKATGESTVSSDAQSAMAVPALVNSSGRRALPVFSSYDALRAWQPEARPVPMSGARVMAAARAEGYDGVVLDVAGPASFTFQIG